MLRQTETTANATVAENVTPVSAAPFTPEEIAQAIAELEKERHSERVEQTDIAQLNDILEQLQLDLPAARVAEQVQKARLLRLETKKTYFRKIFLTAGVVIGCVCTVTGLLMLRAYRYYKDVAPVAQTVMAEPARLTAQNASLAQLVITDTSSGEPVRKTLAEVPEETIVALPGGELQSLLGVPPGYINNGAMGQEDEWMVFRKGNVCYLRGYTPMRQTRDALLATPTIRLYNKIDTLDEPVLMNVPLGAVSLNDDGRNGPSPEGMFDLHVSNPDGVTFGK